MSLPGLTLGLFQLGEKMIMVVDDTEIVLTTVAAALRRTGYSVLEAHSGREALSLARNQPEPVDLLITDVVLPQVRGPEIARQLKTCYPKMKILFMSGYPQRSLAVEGPFLPKPFTATRLLAKVEEVLALARIKPESTRMIA